MKVKPIFTKLLLLTHDPGYHADHLLRQSSSLLLVMCFPLFLGPKC